MIFRVLFIKLINLSVLGVFKLINEGKKIANDSAATVKRRLSNSSQQLEQSLSDWTKNSSSSASINNNITSNIINSNYDNYDSNTNSINDKNNSVNELDYANISISRSDIARDRNGRRPSLVMAGIEDLTETINRTAEDLFKSIQTLNASNKNDSSEMIHERSPSVVSTIENEFVPNGISARRYDDTLNRESSLKGSARKEKYKSSKIMSILSDDSPYCSIVLSPPEDAEEQAGVIVVDENNENTDIQSNRLSAESKQTPRRELTSSAIKRHQFSRSAASLEVPTVSFSSKTNGTKKVRGELKQSVSEDSAVRKINPRQLSFSDNQSWDSKNSIPTSEQNSTLVQKTMSQKGSVSKKACFSTSSRANSGSSSLSSACEEVKQIMSNSGRYKTSPSKTPKLNGNSRETQGAKSADQIDFDLFPRQLRSSESLGSRDKLRRQQNLSQSFDGMSPSPPPRVLSECSTPETSLLDCSPGINPADNSCHSHCIVGFANRLAGQHDNLQHRVRTIKEQTSFYVCNPRFSPNTFWVNYNFFSFYYFLIKIVIRIKLKSIFF